jgi:hypothetical protein
LGKGGSTTLPSLVVETNCPQHGIERYKIKIIKKYNIKQEEIMPKFRTRPRYELSGIVIGKNISYETAREYLLEYLNKSARLSEVMSIRLQK